MASQWYWRNEQIANGPVSFRELVTMVRDEVVGEDDLVRPHYSLDWQAAASVVGLFHMAGRGDVLARWEEERRQEERARLESLTAAERSDFGNASISLSDIEEMLSCAESLSNLDSEEPAWRRRLDEVDAERLLDEGERREELAGERFQQLKGDAIAAAIANLDLKEASLRKRRRGDSWSGWGSRETFQRGLPWGLSFAAANLMALGILSWSDTEALRYPLEIGGAEHLQIFPIWGECSAGVYAFLLLDSVLFAGIAGYAGSQLLVSMTDE